MMFGLLPSVLLTASFPIDSLEAQTAALEKTAALLRNSLLVSNFFILHNLLSTVYTVQLAPAASAKSTTYVIL
jgi:hypothetical protein